jgi:hypothetical protein
MEIMESAVFTKRVAAILTEEQYRLFQIDLLRQPEQGDVVPKMGGIRKTRVASGGHGKGRGARVYYYWAKAIDRLYLVYIHTKGETEQLTKDQEKALAALVRKEFG